MENNETVVMLNNVKDKVGKLIEDKKQKIEEVKSKKQNAMELKSIVDIDGLLDIDFEEVTNLLSGSPIILDKDTYEMNMFFYKQGVGIPSFRISSRFQESEKYINGIFNAINDIKKSASSLNEEALEQELSFLTEFCDSIRTDYIEGEIRSLKHYSFALDDSWNERERLNFYSLLLKGNILALKKKEELVKKQKQEALKEHVDTEASIVEDKVDQMIVERSSIEDKPLDFDDDFVLLELPDDVKSSVNAMSKIVDSYKNSLARALEYSPRMLTITNAFVQLKEKKISLSEIKESMYQDDFKYFILYVIKSKYEEIIDCTNMSYLGDDSEIIDFIADILGESKTFIEQLNEIEEKEKEERQKQEELQEENFSDVTEQRNVLLYMLNDKKSMLERNIKGFDTEQLKDLGNLIDQIESGGIKSNNPFAKNIPYKFKWLMSGSVFITFRMLPDNHVLIYAAGLLQDLQKKQTTDLLASYDITKEMELVAELNDKKNMGEESLNYKKSIATSELALNSMKECINKAIAR